MQTSSNGTCILSQHLIMGKQVKDAFCTTKEPESCHHSLNKSGYCDLIDDNKSTYAYCLLSLIAVLRYKLCHLVTVLCAFSLFFTVCKKVIFTNSGARV